MIRSQPFLGKGKTMAKGDDGPCHGSAGGRICGTCLEMSKMKRLHY